MNKKNKFLIKNSEKIVNQYSLARENISIVN